MIAEVFEGEGQRLQLLVNEAQAKLDVANADKATCQATIDSADAALQAKLEEIKEKEAALVEDINDTKEAEAELQEAIDQRSSAIDAKSVLNEKLQQIQSAKVESFELLRDGGCDNVKEQ